VGIVEAQEELHSNRAFHRKFAPEHVLLKVSGRDVVEDEIPFNFESGPIFNPNHEGIEPIAADLIQKLLSQKSWVNSGKGIVEALEELHLNRAFHRNFAPEHVLLKVSGSDVVVKFCGLGSSILTKRPFILDNYLAKEKLRRGKTLWNLFSNGKYKFKEDEIPFIFESGPIFNPNHEGLESIAADLIQKLLSQKYDPS
nr:hypothetical protein [Tanacetum cinerariifolium]